MPLVAAAVCPHPPVLVPELAAGAAAELAGLRAACDVAVARLAGAGVERLLVVGGDTSTREHAVPARGSFAPWGVPVAVGGSGDTPELAGHVAARGPAEPGGGLAEPGGGADAGVRLPVSLLVAAWLLGRRPDAGPPVRLLGVAHDADPAECAGLGKSQPDHDRWALLVMGDGSACRGLKSPGYDDPRAQPYDDAVAAALAGADADTLSRLDPEESAGLLVAGRAPWQVLAGAVAATGAAWRGDLTYYEAPYGVAYFVAAWKPVAVSARSAAKRSAAVANEGRLL